VGKDRQLNFVELKLYEISEISQKYIEYQFGPVVRMLCFCPNLFVAGSILGSLKTYLTLSKTYFNNRVL
jgi:hypothetical protein